MKWTTYAGALVAVTPIVCQASVYLTQEQAKKLIFPNNVLTKQNIRLNNDQINQLHKTSGITSPLKTDQVYKSNDGGWFIVDQVLGKHEMITYAVGLNANGTVKQIEILEYNESYGSQVKEPSWRQQFVGKSNAVQPMLGKNIKNISGATLSSKHITDGVRRILQFYAMELKTLK